MLEIFVSPELISARRPTFLPRPVVPPRVTVLPWTDVLFASDGSIDGNYPLSKIPKLAPGILIYSQTYKSEDQLFDPPSSTDARWRIMKSLASKNLTVL